MSEDKSGNASDKSWIFDVVLLASMITGLSIMGWALFYFLGPGPNDGTCTVLVQEVDTDITSRLWGLEQKLLECECSMGTKKSNSHLAYLDCRSE